MLRLRIPARNQVEIHCSSLDELLELEQLRAQSSEWLNAMARNRGLRQMPVRGLKKCNTIALIYALAHNIIQVLNIRPSPMCYS